MLTFLRDLFVYDKWATERSSATLEIPANPRAQSILSHVLLAQKIWLTRLNGEDSSSIRVFDELTLANCDSLAEELHDEYLSYIDSLAESDLDRLIKYKNTRGEEFETSIKDILTHVGLHSVYHRGQVALLVRDGGGEASGTDHILFTRL